MWNAEYGKVIYRRPHYRIQEVCVGGFGPAQPMLELQIKIRGRFIFARREHIISNTPEGVKNALERIKATGDKFAAKQGWLKLYGYNDTPLDEFSFKDGGGLEEFAHISPRTAKQWLWDFHGNHRLYSAAFWYIVWDRDLASQIKGKLKELGLPKPQK